MSPATRCIISRLVCLACVNWRDTWQTMVLCLSTKQANLKCNHFCDFTQGEAVASTLFGEKPVVPNYEKVPSAVFGWPEFATVVSRRASVLCARAVAY